MIRIGVKLGRTKLFETVKRLAFLDGLTIEVIVLLIRLEYSYLQCH
jgi:hypothetical protein